MEVASSLNCCEKGIPLVVYILHVLSAFISSACPERVVSTRFEKLPDRHFTCDVTSTSLSTSTVNAVNCALSCSALEDCKNFAITTGYQSSCVYCPAKNITGLTSATIEENVQTRTWVALAVQYTDPPLRTDLPAPGVGATGTLIVVRGSTPVPIPRKFTLDFLHRAENKIILRFSRYAEGTNFIRMHARLNGMWENKYRVDVQQGLFPFTEGHSYRIDFIITKQGFVVYVNDVYLMTYDKTVSLLSSIDTIFYKFEHEVSDISF